MTNEINWHSINGVVVDALNHLSDFAEFNELTFHMVLPCSGSDWWREGSEYEVAVRLQFDELYGGDKLNKSQCRQTASSPGIHLEMPEDIDTLDNREMLLREAKTYLGRYTQRQVVTFGEASRAYIELIGEEELFKTVTAEVIELYDPAYNLTAIAAQLHQPTHPK